MKLINKLLWLSLLLLPVACIVEPMEDNLSDRLECGSDRFDISIDECDFTDGNGSEPGSITVSDGKVTLSLHGEVKSRKDWHDRWERRTLSFTFPIDTMKLEHFDDLVALDSFVVNLGSKDSCLVEWKRDYKTDTLAVQSGELTFTRSKLIGLDGDRNSVFLSGVFDFKYEGDDKAPDTVNVNNPASRPHWIYGEGWFDVVITGRNFEKK